MKLKYIFAGLTAFTMMLTGSLTAYADDSYGKFVENQDNWKFTNSANFFTNGYYLTEEDRAVLMNTLNNTEKRSVRNMLSSEWGGSCYGMAVTAMLACYDLIDYGAYRTYPYIGAPSSLYDMTTTLGGLYPNPTEKMQSLINYYQMLQMSNDSRQYSAYMMYEKTDAERLRYLLSCLEDGSPVLTAPYGDFYAAGTRMGHGIVCYAVEHGTYEYNGKSYDGRILNYDNAVPIGYSTRDDYSIYFSTEDWSWYHPNYQLDSENGACLTYISEDIHHINSCGLLDGTEEYVSEHPFMDVFVTSSMNSAYSLNTIRLMDGTWECTNESMEHCKEMDAFYIDGVDSAAINFLLPGEEKGYMYEMEDAQELETAMYYENAMIIACASSASQVVFHPSGYTEISGNNTEYTLEMVWNEGYYQGSWYDFTVSGTADTASLQKTEDGYLLKSDNLRNVTAAAGNDETQATLTFSTDADSVLLCEVNNSTLAAKIDTDGDGVYETELSAEPETAVYGDFNADGEVNAVDAALILQYAAYAGAGGEMSFEEYLI